jgi:hypothetical protein
MPRSRAVSPPQTITARNSGLCGGCVHARLITSDRASTFLQCQLSFTDHRFDKYPRLPVLACNGYKKQTGAAGLLTADH